jgi:hypothetical protein
MMHHAHTQKYLIGKVKNLSKVVALDASGEGEQTLSVTSVQN